MPSYFYHLKFELYPSEQSIASAYNTVDLAGKGNEVEGKEEVWVPPPQTDIFETTTWPSHQGVERIESTPTQAQVARSEAAYLKGVAGPAPAQKAKVIDCGPTRGVDISPSIDKRFHSPASAQAQETPVPNPILLPSSQTTAQKDWRYDAVRIESIDMAPPAPRPEAPTRSTSALAPNSAEERAGGRVTKARFEVQQRKTTSVGWGVVHLYREGDESVGLGAVGEMEVYSSLGEGEEKEEDCTALCIPAVPNYFTASDFLGWVGERTWEKVSHFRMVMTGRMNRYLVLMKFRNGNEAKKWRAEWDGKVFSDVEPETCHVTFIASITFTTPSPSNNSSFPELSHDPFTPSAATPFLKPFPPPTPNLVELPTCPVCLERMDDTSGLLTILCQHVFHCACLQKWRGSGCPVCRHTNPSPLPPSSYPGDALEPFGSPTASLCSVCDSTSDLWICLICGSVGCGRYRGGHAKEHWKESAHNFALEIETQHVWDYAGDLWVHRLIRGKGDSKVIDLPHRGGDTRTHHEDLVPREKLEGIGLEYTHLITSQLESQRVYFDGLMRKAVEKAEAASAAAASASSRADDAVAALQTLQLSYDRLQNSIIPDLEKDVAREKRRADKSAELARGFGASLREEKRVGEGLMERVAFLNGKMETLSRENEELRETNRDLLFAVEGAQRLREMQEGGQLEGEELGGAVVSLPEREKESVKKGKKGKGKGKGKA